MYINTLVPNQGHTLQTVILTLVMKGVGYFHQSLLMFILPDMRGGGYVTVESVKAINLIICLVNF